MEVQLVSIIFLMIAIVFQELRIASLRTKVMFLDRQRKSMLKGMEVQHEINENTNKLLEHLTDLAADLLFASVEYQNNDK